MLKEKARFPPSDVIPYSVSTVYMRVRVSAVPVMAYSCPGPWAGTTCRAHAASPDPPAGACSPTG